MTFSAIPIAIRRRVFERDGGRRRYCQLAQIGQAAIFHINHIVPRSKGGATLETNLALQCPYCSLHKSDKLKAADPLTGAIVDLFHPLEQTWMDHFSMDAAGVCHGLTPIGRATIETLRMNDSLPRIARSIQIPLTLMSPTTERPGER